MSLGCIICTGLSVWGWGLCYLEGGICHPSLDITVQWHEHHPHDREHGISKMGKARFWPWFTGKSLLLLFPLSSEAVSNNPGFFLEESHGKSKTLLFFFSTLVTGPTGSFNSRLRDTRVYEPQIRPRLATAVCPRFVVLLSISKCCLPHRSQTEFYNHCRAIWNTIRQTRPESCLDLFHFHFKFRMTL